MERRITCEGHGNNKQHIHKMRGKKRYLAWLLTPISPGSKSVKCMEIVSNPTIMDVSHTTDSYGSSSVLLAVIVAKGFQCC